MFDFCLNKYQAYDLAYDKYVQLFYIYDGDNNIRRVY